MIKKLFVLCMTCCATLTAYPQHAPNLASPLQKISRLPEGQKLIEEVEAQGPISIKVAPPGLIPSRAAWFPDERIIYINYPGSRSQGSIICSMLFELHNALHEKKFHTLEQKVVAGTISRSDFIESVERVEYEGAVKMVQILEKGVSQGIFPRDAYWPIAPNFAEHFRVQVEGGHAQDIGTLYDNIRAGLCYVPPGNSPSSAKA